MSDAKLPFAMKSQEESWILAAHPFFSDSFWMNKPKEIAIAEIMKASGGQLHPGFIHSRVEKIYSSRGL